MATRRQRPRKTAPKETTSESASFIRNLKRGQQVILGLGATAAALVSIAGLVKLFQHSDPPPRAERKLEVASVGNPEPNVDRRTYCQQQAAGFRASCLANGQPTDLGDEFQVGVHLTGYAIGKPCCELHYTVYWVDDKDQHLGAVPGYRNVPAVGGIVPRNDLGDNATFDVWVPYPPPGKVRIVFQTYDADGPKGSLETRMSSLSSR